MVKLVLQNQDDIGADVILVVGQSNAAGYGQGLDATYLDIPDARIKQYAGISSTTYTGTVVAAIEPLFHHKLAPSSDRIGFAMTYARNYVRALPVNRHVLIVPAAHGDTGFTTTSVTPAPAGYHNNTANDAGCWDPAATDGGVNLAVYAVAQTNAALALNPNNRIAAILWHQGEADGGNMTQAQYAAALDRLIAYLRTNITGATNAPFILGQMVPSYVALTTQIGLAHVDTPRRNQRSAFVYGPTSTTLVNATEAFHYNAAGQRILGKSYWDALPLAQVNITGTAPNVPTNLTLSQTAGTITATWARPLSRVTDYNVRYSTNAGTSWTPLTRTQSIDVTATITGLSNGQTVAVQVAAVNETGTSAWTASTTTTVVAPPAQVTGLATGTATSTGVPLTWTATTGATSYTVQYRATGAGSWTTFGTAPTTNSATVTGLTAATGYDFQVAAVNAAGTGTYSTTVTATTAAAAATTLIDTVGVATIAAYSTRRLRTAYTGNAIQVRRTSDSTTTDIGFTASGDLDQTALLAFAGAGSAYVAKWYDQSGNTRDLVQATAAGQARIVNAGVVDKGNGTKPCAVFDGAATIYPIATAPVYANGSASFTFVATNNNTGTSSIYAESRTSIDARYNVYQQSTGSTDLQIKSDAAATVIDNAKGGTAGGIHQYTILDTGTSVTTVFDGTGSTGTYTRAATTLTQATFGARRDVSSNPTGYYLGTVFEFIIWSAALNGTQQTAAQSGQKAYFGTP